MDCRMSRYIDGWMHKGWMVCRWTEGRAGRQMSTWVYQFRRRLCGWMEGWVDAWIDLSLKENPTVPSYFTRADFKVSL